jgi:hypothetical protein
MSFTCSNACLEFRILSCASQGALTGAGSMRHVVGWPSWPQCLLAISSRAVMPISMEMGTDLAAE